MRTGRESIRFTDWSIVEESGSTGLVDDRRPFFGGDDVDTRMTAIRRHIHHIRHHWDRFDEFMADLSQTMARRTASFDTAEADLARRLMTRRRDWGAIGDFSALELYTSDAGYRALFGIVNESFRSAGFTSNTEVVRSAVFLIELLTIDLFNYRLAHPESDGFQGTVYRGMSLPDDDIDVFQQVMDKPISQRFVSVPLGMLSASASAEVATRVASANARGRGDRTTVLWRIEVLDLGTELLGLYRQRFPSSVVTSICAVPITGISRFPEEREILLRGPFFQILDVDRRRTDGDGKNTLTIDAVMLNSNRDHVSNIAHNEGEDRRMRDLFRVLVTRRRAGFAAAFAGERGHVDDSRAYQEQFERADAELGRFPAE